MNESKNEKTFNPIVVKNSNYNNDIYFTYVNERKWHT